MKNLSLLVFILTLLVSCTKKQDDRRSALQGTIDDTFFGSINSQVAPNEDGSYTISGVNGNEIINLTISNPENGTYVLGQGTPNSANYIVNNELVYSTDPFGSGVVNITNWNANKGEVTGNFTFTALIPGVDTVRVNNGLIFKVPFGIVVPPDEDEEEEEEEDPQTNAGTFAAKVDGVDFNPLSVTAIKRTNGITISGINATEAISIVVPTDVLPGSYQMSDPGFSATYREGDTIENAISGSIIVTTHDTNTMIIQGTFSFDTQTYTITNGQFTVLYEEL